MRYLTRISAGCWLILALVVSTPVAAQNTLDFDEIEVEPGQEFALSIIGEWEDDVTGFTVVSTFTPNPPIENFSLEVNNSLVGELNPDFIIVNLDLGAGEFIYAVLFELEPPFGTVTLPPVGFPLDLAEVTGTIVDGIPDQDIDFDFTDGLGSPPVNNIYVVDFQSVGVSDTSPGMIQVRTPPPPPIIHFIRGDVNMDETLNIADVIYHLDYTFQQGPLPPCEDAGDANDDGHSDVSDAIFLLDYLYSTGAQPTQPFPGPGPDITPDPIGCENPL